MKNLCAALLLCASLAAAAHAQKPHTDREHEGLKGPVKSVLVESAELKYEGGRRAAGPRSVTERATYDAEGNRVNDEWYRDGELTEKNAYKYVGGVKVADRQSKPPTVIIPSSEARPGAKPAPASAAPPTQRSTLRHRRKYDGKGNVVELVMEDDEGTRSRLTYHRAGDRKETRGSLEQGPEKFTYKVVETFDARGNVIRREDVSETGYVLLKTSYSAYKLDERGNWIERLVSYWMDEAEKPHFEPARVEYRTITYF